MPPLDAVGGRRCSQGAAPARPGGFGVFMGPLSLLETSAERGTALGTTMEREKKPKLPAGAGIIIIVNINNNNNNFLKM